MMVIYLYVVSKYLNVLVILLTAPYIPYKITVSAANGAGVGEYQTIFAFTTEGGILY